MAFNEVFHIFELKNKATSNVKIYQILSSLPLNKIGTYLGDGPFSIGLGIVRLHPTKRTHWVK